MLVAVSGSQGCGKSTMIQILKDKGFLVTERKIARSILEDWNVSLKEVNDSPELTIKFQDELIDRKYQDDTSAMVRAAGQVVFTERTFADVFTYTLVSLGKDNIYSEWLNKYYERCIAYQQIYSRVFYLRAGHFHVQDDGVRGSNMHYSRMVDLTMLEYTQQMTRHERLSVIDTPSREQRLAIISAHTL